MPLIKITLSGVSPDDLPAEPLQAATTRLMADLLGKRRDLTVVAVDYRPAAALSVDGRPLNGRGAFMEANITTGTNGAAEQAAFIAAAHALLSDALGGSAAPIYVVLNEVPASAWGYDGQTQAARRLAATVL